MPSDCSEYLSASIFRVLHKKLENHANDAHQVPELISSLLNMLRYLLLVSDNVRRVGHFGRFICFFLFLTIFHYAVSNLPLPLVRFSCLLVIGHFLECMVNSISSFSQSSSKNCCPSTRNSSPSKWKAGK